MVKFKRTLALDARGDIKQDEQGKFNWYDGIRGVKQELKLTLATIQGEQPFAPDFGLDIFEVTGSSEPVLRRELRFTLEQDDRVRRVENINAEVDPEQRTANVEITVQLVTDETVTLREQVNG